MAERRLSRRQIERIKKLHDKRRQKVTRKAAQQAEDLYQRGGLGPERTGLVIANYGPALIVEDSEQALFRCALRQNLGTAVCGDRVIWQVSGQQEGVVVAITARRSLLARPDYNGRTKPLAANLDQVAVVIAPRPELNEFLIDRYLVAINTIDVEPLLVLNKVDLLTEYKRTALEARLATYQRIGYALVYASNRTDAGLDNLRKHLKQRTSILVGQSGVGKSSLIKTLLPDRDIRIQALSQATGYGTHTTTTSTLYHLPDGGDLIDSPGVRSFELGPLLPNQLEQGFIEFMPYLGQCKFSNCSHRVEPDCAILAAVARGDIDSRRLMSYHQLSDTLG